jgi:hypothetical protein
MPRYVEAVERRSTPYPGVQFTESGQVLAIDDDAIVDDLVRIEGFREVFHPAASKAVTEPDPDPDPDPEKVPDPEGGEATGEKPAAGRRGRKVTE